MIVMKIECSMCSAAQPLEFTMEREEQLSVAWLRKKLKQEHWTLQVNGGHLDTYCCRTCAK